MSTLNWLERNKPLSTTSKVPCRILWAGGHVVAGHKGGHLKASAAWAKAGGKVVLTAQAKRVVS